MAWQEGDTFIGVEYGNGQLDIDYPMLQIVEELPNGNFLLSDSKGEKIEVDEKFLDSIIPSYRKIFDDAYIAERVVGDWS